MNVDAEILELKRRLDAVEQEVTSQLTVIKHIYRVVNENRDGIADMAPRLRNVETDVASLRRDMPSIVADAMREVHDRGSDSGGD